MTPRSIAPVLTSGAPAHSTSTPPAALIGPRPSAPTTGWSSAPCSPNPRSPRGSCRSPAGSTSASRGCRWTRGYAGIPHQVRTGRRVAPRADPRHQGQAFGRFRRRLRLGERGPAAAYTHSSTSIEFLTRLRCNARLYALPLPPEQYPEGKPGPKPKWGQRLEPPRRGGMWNAKWQVGTAFVYGRQREIRWKEIIWFFRF